MTRLAKRIKVRGQIYRQEPKRKEYPMLLSLDMFRHKVKSIKAEVLDFQQEFIAEERMYMHFYQLKLDAFPDELLLKVTSYRDNPDEWVYVVSLTTESNVISDYQSGWILKAFMQMIMENKPMNSQELKHKLLTDEPIHSEDLVFEVE